jgi:hypothetical protein
MYEQREINKSPIPNAFLQKVKYFNVGYFTTECPSCVTTPKTLGFQE